MRPDKLQKVNSTNFRRFGELVAACAVCTLIASGALAAVTATPDSVSLNARDQKAHISLTHDGKPVEASAIKGFGLRASGHHYAHMLTLVKEKGGVTINPSKTAEVGSYDLEINTKYGMVTVALNMQLTSESDGLAERAKAEGISEEELKARLGVGFHIGGETITFTVPQYHTGDAFKMVAPCPADHEFEWRVNGAPAEKGRGPQSFSFVFPKPGSYVMEYIERKDGNVVVKGNVTCSVMDAPVTTTPVAVAPSRAQ